MLLRYLVNSAENVTEDQYRKSLGQILEQGGDVMATLAQKWKEEGSETTKWTIARKSLKMGFDIDSIAEITGLPESKIKLLASKMNIKKTRSQ